MYCNRDRLFLRKTLSLRERPSSEVRSLFFLLLAISCAENVKSPDGEGGSADTATEGVLEDEREPDAPELFETVSFRKAMLTPPFFHGNASWAGAALLDVDGDGWLDIYMTNGASQPNSLYRNRGDGTFEDVGEASGVALMKSTSSVSAGDIDNDGDPDLVVGMECTLGSLSASGTSVGDGGLVVLLNDGAGRFVQTEIEAEGDVLERGFCPVSIDLVDLNGDGNLDVVSNNGIDPDHLYPWKFGLTASEAVDHIVLGDGQGGFAGSMELVGPTQRADPGPESPFSCPLGCSTTTFTSVYFDVNRDGRMDRISGEGGRPLLVFLQDEEGRLVYEESFAVSGFGQWMGMAVADFDGDDDLDIYSTNQGMSPFIVGYDNLPPPHSGIWLNPFHTLFERLPSGAFEERSDWPLDAGHTLATDIYEPEVDPFTGEPLHAQWFPLGNLERYGWGWAAVSVDLDLDGWMDVAFTGNNCAAPMPIIWNEANGAGPGGLLLNQAGAGFRDVIVEWEIPNTDSEGRYQDGRSLVSGDLNNDGAPDLVFVNKTYNPSQSNPLAQEAGTPSVWLSKPREGGFLRVELEGTTSNRDGIGSEVVVNLGSHTQRQILGVSGATNGSSERALLFGLGAESSVDVSVTFPSGIVVERTAVTANTTLRLVEP